MTNSFGNSQGSDLAPFKPKQPFFYGKFHLISLHARGVERRCSVLFVPYKGSDVCRLCANLTFEEAKDLTDTLNEILEAQKTFAINAAKGGRS